MPVCLEPTWEEFGKETSKINLSECVYSEWQIYIRLCNEVWELCSLPEDMSALVTCTNKRILIKLR